MTEPLNWQPISTAPKGRFVALRLANGGETWGDFDSDANGWALENWSICSSDPIEWAKLPANLPKSFFERRPGEEMFPEQRRSADRRLPPFTD